MKHTLLSLLLLVPFIAFAQTNFEAAIDADFKNTLLLHKEFVGIPNLPENEDLMLQNMHWVTHHYEALGFNTSLLETGTLPILLTEKVYDPSYKTVLFYFHIDGQPVNPDAWDQENPFKPVLKEQSADGSWKAIDWSALGGLIDNEWRIFGRAAADDKAPIVMFLRALKVLQDAQQTPRFNIKVIFDPEEEYGSKALLSSLDRYKERYASDYFIVMDGPAHNSNKPTVTFGCRGIAACSITTYGAKLPQHSGHYGNYTPNPVFGLSRLLASMKDDSGKVLIKDYYKGITINKDIEKLLASVPYDADELHTSLGIHTAESVGKNYQEALQYPSLNVRQIGTSWKGKGLKTVIPEYATADIDVRLVPETDGAIQLEKIKTHIEQQGYYILDREPTDVERQTHPRIAKFIANPRMNAFRTSPESAFGLKVRRSLKDAFGENPIVIRLMGGTVPIVPLINELDVPTTIIPMVNMDNNQHSPNENIRLGNIRQGIRVCLAILNSEY